MGKPLSFDGKDRVDQESFICGDCWALVELGALLRVYNVFFKCSRIMISFARSKKEQ